MYDVILMTYLMVSRKHGGHALEQSDPSVTVLIGIGKMGQEKEISDPK